MGSSTESGSATRILDVTESLVQQRGFNAVSYGDIAAELHMTTPAVHYHYRSKSDLGAALVERYRVRFGQALDQLESDTPRQALIGYVSLFDSVLVRDRMCLCGMLAAEYSTLPEAMQRSVLGFFADSEAWLARQLERGQRDGSLTLSASPQQHAQVLLSALEGAMLVARAHNEPHRLRTVADPLLATLVVS